MAIDWKYAGLGDVSSYLVSSIPYVSSSISVPESSSDPIEITFPFVTKTIVVTNTLPGTSTNIPLRFGFSENGVKGVENNNYLVLNNGESFEADYKVSKLFLLSDTTLSTSASIAASITGIPVKFLSHNWSGSLGVG